VDGVPDDVIEQIINEIIKYVKNTEKSHITPAKKEILLRRRDFELALLKRHR